MTTVVEAPARADGVRLIGAMAGSGYRTPPALVRRGDGQTLQLTRLLYLVLEAADGRRSLADIAEVVGRATGRQVTPENVRALVDEHLRPLGLLRLADGGEPPLKRTNPLLGLSLRVRVTDPATTRRLTAPFQFLFRPVVAGVVVLGFVAITWWVFFAHGLGASAYDAFQRPHLLLLVFVVSVLSGGFHEFGHAAAARYGGAEPGVMGAGLYLVWPAFYTDVTDSYRLDRAGRIRTDLGGMHFNAVVVVITFVWWYTTGWEALLLLVATQTLQMVQQLLPLLRFDGYHLLADIAGVPDLYHRIRPTLAGLLPHRWGDPSNRLLTPWARAVITLWVLVTVPMMVLMLAAVVQAVPRLLGTAVAVVREDAEHLGGALSGGVVDASAHLLQVLGVVLPTLACILILCRVGMRGLRGLATWSRGSLPKRATAALLSAVVATGLSWAWWPDPGTYRPIEPGEKGLLTQLLPAPEQAAWPDLVGLARTDALPAGLAVEDRLAAGRPVTATFASPANVPTRDDPQLALVLVPSSGHGADSSGGGGQGGQAPAGTGDLPTDESAEPWIFPFDMPLPPEEGDNQALAVNTTDDSMTYDVAFALVWADGDEVLNVNEAHAYASCSRCVTVAVAFQVVLIMDDAQVVVPQNLSVAANYECYRCITAALASQLVLSVEEAPGEQELLELAAVWNRLTEFGQNITSYTLSEITAELEEVKAEIIAILGSAPTVTPTSEPTASPTPSEEPTPSTSDEPTSESSSPTESPTTATSEAAPTTPSEETTTLSPSPTESSSPTPTGEATTEETSTSSPSPTP